MHIDKDVPLPVRRVNNLTSIIASLRCGDSVFIPGGTTQTVASALYLVRKFRENRRAPNFTYTSRKIEGGVRMWCTHSPQVPPDTEIVVEVYMKEEGVPLPTEAQAMLQRLRGGPAAGDLLS